MCPSAEALGRAAGAGRCSAWRRGRAREGRIPEHSRARAKDGDRISRCFVSDCLPPPVQVAPEGAGATSCAARLVCPRSRGGKICVPEQKRCSRPAEDAVLLALSVMPGKFIQVSWVSVEERGRTVRRRGLSPAPAPVPAVAGAAPSRVLPRSTSGACPTSGAFLLGGPDAGRPSRGLVPPGLHPEGCCLVSGELSVAGSRNPS